LCKTLKLVNHTGSLDLFDECGKQATVFRRFPASARDNASRLLYLRRDLLERYLANGDRRLVWITWGERTLHYSELQRREAAVQNAWEQHRQVHKQFDVFATPPS
jgi:hypothetical protein